VYFEPGIFYVGKSSEFSTSSGQTTTVSTVDLKGIRIPVGLGINLLGNEKSTVSLRGFGGASAFFITSEDFSSTINNLDLKSTDFGLYAGAGIDIWKLFLDVSYEWSVTNIQEDVSQVDVGKSRNLWITGGLRLNF
jgi:hypothetical protein